MVHLRPAATQEIRRLLQTQTGGVSAQVSQVYLGLEPGGCGEWTYRLAAAISVDVPTTSPMTTVVCDDISLTIPTEQIGLLQDLTIDYTEDLMGGGFRFINPQAQSTCGCGNAFSTTAHALASNGCTPATQEILGQWAMQEK